MKEFVILKKIETGEVYYTRKTKIHFPGHSVLFETNDESKCKSLVPLYSLLYFSKQAATNKMEIIGEIQGTIEILK